MIEIDYADILRERAGTGESATWDRILTALERRLRRAHARQRRSRFSIPPWTTCWRWPTIPIAWCSSRNGCRSVGKASGDDSIQQRKSLLGLMHGLANYTAERKPDELDAVLDKMAGAAAQLPPDMLLTLITDPPPMPLRLRRVAHGPGRRAAVAADRRDAHQVPGRQRRQGSRRDQSAGDRVPDPGAGSRRSSRRSWRPAGEQAKALFQDDPQFENVWTSSSEMLMSYSDEKFVSEGYARELTTAQTQAIGGREDRRRPAGPDPRLAGDRRG